MRIFSLVNNNNILSSGLDVDVVTPLKFGESVLGLAPTLSESTVDLTTLAHNDYPMQVMIHAEAPARLQQGDSGVTLAGISGTIVSEDMHHIVRIDSETEAYFALQAESTPSGVVYFTRVDKIY
jgi:hypothetical protein